MGIGMYWEGKILLCQDMLFELYVTDTKSHLLTHWAIYSILTCSPDLAIHQSTTIYSFTIQSFIHPLSSHSFTHHPFMYTSIFSTKHASIYFLLSFLHPFIWSLIPGLSSVHVSINHQLSNNPCSQSILCISHKIPLFSWCPGSFPRSYFYIIYQNCATGDGAIRNKE